MVGNVEDPRGKFGIKDILTEKQVHHIVKESLGDECSWRLIGCEMRPASVGLTGFLGDHFRVTIHAMEGDVSRKIHLFVKSMPLANEPKAKFINEYKFFKREMLMYKLCKELRGAEGAHPWSTKAFIHTDTITVMPDLTVEGFTPRPLLETLDMQHMLVTTASLARFHAAYANYETNKSIQLNRPYNILQEYGDVITESTFQDTPWLRAAAKLTANIIKIFSKKFKEEIPSLEQKLRKLYIESCGTVKDYSDTLNVIIHKDLWVNNILFKHEGDVPTAAVLVDFQCVRYAPPAFDLLIFYYLNSTRSFREQHETTVFHHYFTTFMSSVDDLTKQRLKELKYDFNMFLKWCEESRSFGALQAATIFPYVLMDPESANKNMNDPETFDRFTNDDRTEVVVEYARKCSGYRERLLEVSEEFVERYVLKQL